MYTSLHDSWDVQWSKVFPSSWNPDVAINWSSRKLCAFHAITGCYSVSQFSGHGTKTAWAVFKQHHTDLIGLGKGSLTEKHCYINREIHLQDVQRARGWYAQQSTSQVVLYRSYTRDSATNLRCSNISHHAVPLSSKCLEPSTLAVSWSSSSDRNGMDASGRSASATVAFSATYPESLQGDHLMWLYEVVPQPTLQLHEHLKNTLFANKKCI